MSPASYLTAPPRVAAASIAPVTIDSLALFWLSVAAVVVLPAIGIVVVVRRGLALWRDLKRAARAFGAALDDVGRKLESMSTGAEGLSDVTARAEPPADRLRVSLARLAVLRSALRDVQDSVGRVTAVYPRK
jgi:Flp pilus assembly protein TadB